MIRDIRRRAALWIFIVIVVGIQFIRPDLGIPPVDPGQSLYAQLSPPPPVQALLMRSCNDCHGLAKKWPWYARVAPVSWLIGSDVMEARGHLDFSEWGSKLPNDQAWALQGMCKLVKRGDMPLPRYLWMHRAARPTPDEVAALCDWTNREAERLSGGKPITRPPAPSGE